MSADGQPDTVFGLDVGGVLSADETPLDVLGCVKYLDANGRVDYIVFYSEGIQNVDALGMARYTSLQCDADAETAIMMSVTMEDDDDDD